MWAVNCPPIVFRKKEKTLERELLQFEEYSAKLEAHDENHFKRIDLCCNRQVLIIWNILFFMTAVHYIVWLQIRFEGWTEEESAPLLEFLFEHVSQTRFVTRIHWVDHMVALWDNKSTIQLFARTAEAATDHWTMHCTSCSEWSLLARILPFESWIRLYDRRLLRTPASPRTLSWTVSGTKSCTENRRGSTNRFSILVSFDLFLLPACEDDRFCVFVPTHL